MSVILGIPTVESAVTLPRFQTKSGERQIDPRRIVYLSAQVNYTLFHLDNGEQVITTHSLSIYASLLETRGFVRVHKSYLLNSFYLNRCQLKRSTELILPNGTTLEVARRRRSTLRKMIKRQRVDN